MRKELKIFKSIRCLDENREKWTRRTVVTVDFTDGLDTYVERITYDIDQKHIVQHSKLSRTDTFYVPIAWRPRETFLEFDCVSNSGTSLQLTELAIRQRYCEWYFWQRCRELKVVKPSKITSKLRSCLKSYVEDGKPEAFGTCSKSDQETWVTLLDNISLNAIYRQIGKYKPLVLRIANNDDVSIIKIKERKTLRRPPRRTGFDALKGSMVGTVCSINAGRTKLIAPIDMRFKCVDGFMLKPDVHSLPTKVKTEVLGDGGWAYCNTGNTDQQGDYTLWRLTMTPRRSRFISPGFRVLLLVILAIFYWQIFDVNASSGRYVLSGFSMAVVGSVFLYYLRLFDVKRTHSFQFRWASTWQRSCLMFAYATVLIFPFIEHLLNKFSALVSKLPECSIFNFEGFAALLRSDTTVCVVRWSIIIAILALLIDFVIVNRYA